MSTISTVAVDFIANVGKYVTGLDGLSKKTKTWSDKTKGEAKGVTAAFDNTTKSISNLAKGLVGLVAIQRIGAAFANAATQVSLLADEAEKVGASAAQFDKLRLAAERNGANIGDVKIAYKELRKSIIEASNGNKEAIKSFNDLGLSYSYLGNLSPDDAFEATAQALSKITEENKRAEIGTKLLSKAYVELTPLIAKGAGGIETGGRGSLSQNQIQGIDKITKSFEELGRTIDLKIKKSLADASDAILKIVSALQYLIDNLGAVAKLLAAVFGPVLLFKFSQSLAGVSKQLLDLLKQQGKIAAAAALGQPIRPGALLPESQLKSLRDFKGILTVIGAAALTLSIILGKIVASVAALGIGIEIGFGASIFAAQIVGAEKFAEEVKDVRSVFHDFVLESLGFDTESSKTKDFLAKSNERIAAAQKRLAVTANEAGKAIDEEAEAIRNLAEEVKKAEEAFDKAQISYIESVTEGVKTPFEKTTEEFRKLTTAIDGNKITVDTYKKAIADLVRGLDQVDIDKLRRAFGTPYGVIRDTGTSTADQKSAAEAGVRSSFFGVGTVAAPNIQLDTPSNRITDLAERLQGSGTDAKTVFEKQVADINMAAMAVDKYGNAIMSAADKTLALDYATEQYGIASAEAFRKSNEEMFNIVMLTEDFASSLGQAIAAGQSFGEALKNVFQDLTKQIIAMILRSIILQSILAAIGVVSPTGAGTFAAMMNIKPMAAGGPVKGGTPYQVGELGPELFVPEGNGYIVPNNMTGGGGAVVNQTINVQTGVAQTVRAEMLALLPQFRSQAVNAVLETKQRGGSFSKGMTFA